MRFSRFYEFFRQHNTFGIRRVYFARFQVAGYLEHMYAHRHHPSIITSNHQNALIDALIVAASVRSDFQMFFMTRSDVFGTGFDWVLYRWKLRPIYRAQDNIGDVAKANEAIFDEMVRELGNGDCLLIFPEGNHGRVRRLRPLKKGFARIGFQAEEAHDFSLDLLLQPVGLVYWEHLLPGAEILVKYGPPIRFADYTDLYRENPNRALIEIRKATHEAMRKLIHHISSEPFYDVIDSARDYAGKALLREAGQDPYHLDARFLKEKEVIALLESRIAAQDPDWDSFAEQIRAYRDALAQAQVGDDQVGGKPSGGLGLGLRGLCFVLGAPLFAVGALLHYGPYAYANRLALTKFKDDHFHSSIRFAFPLFLYPIYWLLLWGLGWAVLGSFTWSLLWLAFLPASAAFSLSYYRAWKRFVPDWQWSRIRNTEQGRALSDRRASWWNKLKAWRQKEETVNA